MKNKLIIIIISITLLLISLPYLVGLLTGNDGKIFTGIILNPMDGFSYFAKMSQGYEGNWLFQLPFTAEPSRPVFLFFFYILLGHISRILHVPIPVIYHTARLVGYLFMAWQLWRFIDNHLELKHISKTWSYLFILFASGMGWLGLLKGYESGDFVIPEAYPFYSSLINPHFPIGIGLFILIVNHLLDKEKQSYLLLIFSSVVFAIIMPFGSVILCVVISTFWIIQNKNEKRNLLGKILAICIPATLIVGFQYYETITHEQLRIWNQQNVTPTPPIWDILISFSPMILFAFYSLKKWRTYIDIAFYQLILVWFVICLIMIFIPFEFQRRFMFALAIPITILGLYGLNDFISTTKSTDRWKKVVFAMPAISVIFILLISFFAIMGGSSYAFISATEADLYKWLTDNTDNVVILAEPEIAVKIPGLTGNRVYYGHPYETVDAEKKQELLETWYDCENNDPVSIDILLSEKIDLVIVDKWSNNPSCFTAFSELYENDDFILYGVNK